MVWNLLVAVSLVTCAAATNNTQCFECSDVPHPGDCTQVTQCAPGQQCFVDQFITTGGLVLYNSGCESTLRCSQAGRKRGKPRDSSLSRRADITTCSTCCDKSFCNDEGCGSTSLKQPQRGPLCFSCDFENTPDQCRTVAQCDVTEICMLTEIPPKSPEGHTLYRAMCQTPLVCSAYSLVGRKRHIYCHTCCSNDFCNNVCNPGQTPVPTTSKPKTTPTSTPTTPTTTKPTTTPSTTTTTTPATTPKTTIKTTTQRPQETTTTKTTTTTLPHTLSPHDFCTHHSGYRYDQHSHLCYKFHYDHRTWDAANAVCKTENGTLAIIDTKEKWTYLKKQIMADNHYPDETAPAGAVSSGSSLFTGIISLR